METTMYSITGNINRCITYSNKSFHLIGHGMMHVIIN